MSHGSASPNPKAIGRCEDFPASARGWATLRRRRRHQSFAPIAAFSLIRRVDRDCPLRQAVPNSAVIRSFRTRGCSMLVRITLVAALGLGLAACSSDSGPKEVGGTLV